ncbi:MAG TPA: HEAT repeat domain-containing protein [Rhabdochlamydiaceae bacterium]|nr:HEAT repeat domain-containing protein [Rhabdochlamydiaceae bacterium]
MKRYFLTLLLPWMVFAGEKEDVRRIHAHLFVHDPRSAVKEAEHFLKLYPESKELRLAYLQALAEKGDETVVLQEWSKRKDKLQNDRYALEILAWSVLKKGDLSSQLNIHLSSLIGASLTRDVRAVPMLVNALRESNALLRLIAVRFSAQYGDGPLQEELKRMLTEEKVWFVRLEVIRAIGQLRITALRDELKEMIVDKNTLIEEKAEAIIALVQMYDGVRESDLIDLIKGNRSGLRQLACELVSYFNLQENVKDLALLLSDASPDVRAHALHTIGLLKTRVGEKRLKTLMEDSSPLVAITASWVATLQGMEEGIQKLGKWIEDVHPRWRLLAASTLSSCGKKGVALALEKMEKSDDPFVRANLAIGLIGARVEVQKACEVIYDILGNETLLMWDQNSHMRILARSQVSHIDQIPNYPKVVDQMVRLDLLNILCIMQYPKAQEAVKGYVKNEAWGITGAAVAVLLEEGDEGAMTVISGLLKDEDPHIRVQAAFILAMMGSDPEAVKVLQEAYPKMSRDIKIQILEAIGHVGSLESVPFLIDILSEPFQLLRVIAASAMIQCLYH